MSVSFFVPDFNVNPISLTNKPDQSPLEAVLEAVQVLTPEFSHWRLRRTAVFHSYRPVAVNSARQERLSSQL